MRDFYDSDLTSGQSTTNIQRAFMTRVFLWMTVALAITGATAFFTINSPMLLSFVHGNRLVFIGLILCELGLVTLISSRLGSLNASAMTIALMIYSVLNGLTFSVYLLVYTASSVASVFFIAASMFGCAFMAGRTTKVDMSKFSGALIMALIGLIIATIVNVFMKSSGMETALSYIGILIFVGLTMYDAQKLNALALMSTNPEDTQKLAVRGALSLYLDFINIFIMLLRILGRRR